MPENKIKILFIVNDLGIGGVQRLVVDFANFLDREKFDVSVAILFSRLDSYFFRDQLKDDVKFTNFSFKNIYDTREFFELCRFIKKNKFDVVFTQLFVADTVGRLAAFFSHTPVIVTEIQNIITGLGKKFIYTDKLLKYITTACISTTNAVTEYATKVIKFPRRKIFEIPTNLVDKRKFEKEIDKSVLKNELNISPDAKIVINIGRLVVQKGQKALLDAIPLILKEKLNTYFVIVGSGSQEEALKLQAKNLGVEDKVRFLGSRLDTPELLRSSDVFAFPSIWEGQGLILFEAFFSRIPIVASNTGGIPDVVKDNETGILVRPGDADDLAKNILRVLDDPDFGARLAQTAYEKYKDRNMANAIKKIENVFIKLIEDKR
ncbi:MAG: group 1 glycosyl transferase [Parcubacteria group bacterium Athens1014_26]|nr:MAG: group 1 glycosyl transferase [Parcubacteria group bacterium Athens1014_26]